MSITSSLSADGSELEIVVAGSFNFSLQQQFRQTFEGLAHKPKRFRIDMSAASHLDNSALGMLLLLREYAGGDAADIAIANCSKDVRSALTRSNLERMFSIS